jgi:hypothetical protein
MSDLVMDGEVGKSSHWYPSDDAGEVYIYESLCGLWLDRCNSLSIPTTIAMDHSLLLGAVRKAIIMHMHNYDQAL